MLIIWREEGGLFSDDVCPKFALFILERLRITFAANSRRQR